MYSAYPEKFHRRAVSLVVDEGVPAARVAKDLEIAELGLRRWVERHLVDSGIKPGVTGASVMSTCARAVRTGRCG